jgi:predicted TPR repeat methyltransferase
MTATTKESRIISSGDLIADRRYRFGADLAARGDDAGALDLFAQAIEAAPAFMPAWFALGEARARRGDADGAAAAFNRVLKLDPDDHCGAALHLARLGRREPREAMSRAYVRMLFDQYAGRFEAALTRLEYGAPASLRAAVEAVRPGAAFAHMLDLGCGTGLAASAFRERVARFTGVDLSPAMIRQSRAKSVYDRLETADLTAFLAAEHAGGSTYDLVVAADVFVYVFDLAPAVAAVARVLIAGGLFGFTVETPGGDGVDLSDTLRFRHGEGHVREALAAADLQPILLSPFTVRVEATAPVPGLLVLARCDQKG